MLRRFSKPLLTAYGEYRSVIGDSLRSIPKKPVRSLRNALLVGTLGLFWYKNPDENSFRALLIESSNELALVSEPVRNPLSTQRVETLWSYANSVEWKYYNFVFFSIIFQLSGPSTCKTYENTCSHLKPGPQSYYERILDIGFMGKWFSMETAMTDYDINDANHLR